MEKTLRISSKPDNLHIVESIVDELSVNCGIDHDVYGNLMIAALEATNNAITHGNKLDVNKYVELYFSVDAEKILVTVKDEGTGFDYNSIPDPTAPENIENMSGRGVFLMTQLSDKIEFEDNGRFVRMTFYLIKQ
ncbi:MAG: ATP-binding protein [Bacteroidales bacterium]|jgi:serine/threonine-protein kinase RsbW|nr:ATP-binding protein [Bacteroidales bacterium]